MNNENNNEIGWGDDLCSCGSQLERLKKNNSDLKEKLEKTTKALKELFSVMDAHDVDTIDCNRSGVVHCDCLERARKKLESIVPLTDNLRSCQNCAHGELGGYKINHKWPCNVCRIGPELCCGDDNWKAIS